jgi:hypothetical protein
MLSRVAACCRTGRILHLVNLINTVAAMLQASVMTGAFEYYSYFRITIFSLLLVKNQMSTGMD